MIHHATSRCKGQGAGLAALVPFLNPMPVRPVRENGEPTNMHLSLQTHTRMRPPTGSFALMYLNSPSSLPMMLQTRETLRPTPTSEQITVMACGLLQMLTMPGLELGKPKILVADSEGLGAALTAKFRVMGVRMTVGTAAAEENKWASEYWEAWLWKDAAKGQDSYAASVERIVAASGPLNPDDAAGP